MTPTARALNALFLYRDAPLRREALAEPPGAPARYSLFGLDELQADGLEVRHNLEPELEPARHTRAVARLVNHGLARRGGYGGDFASVLAARGAIAATDVVLSTVDTLGIPLALLRRARLVPRVPFVYVSVGLLDRVEALRGERMRRRYREAVGAAGAVVAYGHGEAAALREWLAGLPVPPPVEFVPFGVDTTAFRPRAAVPTVDVVSIGADPQRDYPALRRLADALPGTSFRAVVAPEQARTLEHAANVEVVTGVGFRDIPAELTRGRVVVLPVADNLYSGATTTLLQAMAMARPVVVTRTAAIAEGYGLVDGESCRLVPPGDDEALRAATTSLLADSRAAEALGERGRAHVERELGWPRFVGAIRDALLGAAAARSGR